MADPRQFNEVDRRKFIEYSGAAAAALIFGAAPYTARARAGTLALPDHPFKLGVASGDPTTGGVVLWTRLAPDPLNKDKPGGMPSTDVSVQWEIAEDEKFAKVVRRGTETARPELGHSVHAEVAGLQPGREYFYRFRAGGDISPTGRTKTAPSGGPARARFAFVSCQQYEHGYYTAFRHLAADDPDVILHLGDAIYEYGTDEYKAPEGNVRHHDTPEVKTLDAYRHRHALYRTDADLQAAYAVAPWIVTWDDHEVENNYADDISENDDDPAWFLNRRAAAYQAYYENMPLRRTSVPAGPDAQLYRRLKYGSLLDFHVLDTRQYRDDQASGDGSKPPSAESRDPKRSIMGAAQERWLIDGLAASTARWKIIAQQVFFAQMDTKPGSGQLMNMDAWDGYSANRDRILKAIADRKVANPVVISGDVHANWANELKADFADPKSATLGVEFVGTSITSGGDGSDTRSDTDAILKENPHIKFFNNYRGYVLVDATAGSLRADYRVVPYVQKRGAPIRTRVSFHVDSGRPGLQKVAETKVAGARTSSAETEDTRVRGER